MREYTRNLEQLNFSSELLQLTLERLLFKRFGQRIGAAYKSANVERDSRFRAKLAQIQRQGRPAVLSFLEIRPKLRLPNDYQAAIDELDRIGFLEHPYDKIVG